MTSLSSSNSSSNAHSPKQQLPATANVQEFLQRLQANVLDGVIVSILVSDKDGVEILRAGGGLSESNQDTNEEDMEKNRRIYDEKCQNEQILTTIFSLTTEQTSKVKMLGPCSNLLVQHDDAIIVQSNMTPLILTIRADPNADVTKVLNLVDPLRRLLEPLRRVIARETVVIQ